MTTFDFSPLFRSTVGFDRLARLMESSLEVESGGTAYPPYNIESTGENAYRITMAVAGFSADEITIESRENQLVVAGRKAADEEPRNFLHRGIAGRDFIRKFQLADYVKAMGASLDNGLLHVDLVRELPEEMKPRQISIQTGALAGKPKAKELLENKKDAA